MTSAFMLRRLYTTRSTLELFNRRAKLQQQNRAALDRETSRTVDYLRDEVAQRVCDRLLVCARIYGDQR
jgi:NADH dehydrogenase [ubiquinone] 1 alpha subcomplex assembly factor 5